MSHNGLPAWPSTCSLWNQRAGAQAVNVPKPRSGGYRAGVSDGIAQDFLSFLAEGNTNTLNQTAPTTEGSTQTHQ